MIKRLVGITLCLFAVAGLMAQDISKYIVVDQFGYRPDSRKVAVIRDPQVGFDAEETFSPGGWYSVIDARTGELVFRSEISVWGGGKTDGSSGDRAWQFDFSELSIPGSYYILDQERNMRSYEFVIAYNVYNEVLRQAMRSFFYQRVGFRKEVPYADERWADEASHSGDLQDNNCRSFFDKLNPGSELDVSGGWYDAGDYNKYSSWTASYVTEFMKAYLERPEAWGDDYNIPESGNGRPDILDEAIWGIDHLLRMQQTDGSVLSIVGEAHASPPSSATGASYYGPPNTSATLNTSAAFAIASKVYRDQGLLNYADTLLARSLKAWEWAELHPDSLFHNNNSEWNSVGLGAGPQETDDYGRAMAKLEAACYLFDAIGDIEFRVYFDTHYQETQLFLYNGFAYPFQASTQEFLLYYTTLADGTASVQNHIRTTYRNGVVNGEDNLAAYVGNKDPYLSHTGTYTWGSNGVKSSQGSMNYNLITFGMDEGITSLAMEASECYLHNLHGVNPFNMVYLSNMYEFGAENSVNEFYHSWFSNGSPLWDRVGESTYGPAPGFLTGGPNPGYDWDACCPSGCGSSGNNARCTSESIAPPRGQPSQKSYKDFNTSWPLNSWSVTENSCGYQVRYIRLLSKFVTAGMDCNGEKDGGAFVDSCGVCAGGNTGILPSLDPGACGGPGNGEEGDTMYIEGRHLYSAAGEKVILRGVNEMFVWSDDKTGVRWIPEITKTGANCVRLVWTEEYGQKSELLELIDRCIEHKMIAIPESHDATGEWDKLDVSINFWSDPVLRDGIQRNKKWTMVNIGNEVGDGSVTAAQFKSGYMRAIDSLRGWGYTVPLVIDASTWGQNLDVILQTWKDIQAHDPLHNILFSVHSYWSDITNYNRVANAAINDDLPIIIGEGPSPTAYPNCTILDYQTGLDLCGMNEIGWISWSWGGVANGHCIPNFDHTLNGVFGNWMTGYAADMMVDHPFSLMRTAERPSSFFLNDSVTAGGIYFYPAIGNMTVGDTFKTEVLITPANAFNKAHIFEITGDTASVSFDRESGILVALEAGQVTITAVSIGNKQVRFTREVEVHEIPVSSITITPSEAEMEVGDTIFFSIALLPENATGKEYTIEVLDNSGAVDVDSAEGRIIGLKEGSGLIVVSSSQGVLTDTLSFMVWDPTFTGNGIAAPSIKLYPNPNDGLLHIDCDQPLSFDIKIMDLGGKVVLNEVYTGKTRIKTDFLSPGTYLVVHKGKNMIIRQKLIIL